MARRKKRKIQSRKKLLKGLTCPFNDNPDKIDYKDVHTLKKYITTRGRMLPRTRTGVSHKCQRKLALSVKRARFMSLLPYNQLV